MPTGWTDSSIKKSQWFLSVLGKPLWLVLAAFSRSPVGGADGSFPPDWRFFFSSSTLTMCLHIHSDLLMRVYFICCFPLKYFTPNWVIVNQLKYLGLFLRTLRKCVCGEVKAGWRWWKLYILFQNFLVNNTTNLRKKKPPKKNLV